MMTQDLINRYQPNGDIYQAYADSLGTPAANSIAQAALSGDETQVNAALTQAMFGNPLNTSTTQIFGSELAASGLSIGKKVIILAVIGGLVYASIEFGAINYLKGKFKL